MVTLSTSICGGLPASVFAGASVLVSEAACACSVATMPRAILLNLDHCKTFVKTPTLNDIF
jgi:hypothetical protein